MNRIGVDSSNVVSIGYDEDASILEIEFRNGIYQYFEVPSHIHEELMAADSKGSFIHENVKNIFNYEKL